MPLTRQSTVVGKKRTYRGKKVTRRRPYRKYTRPGNSLIKSSKAVGYDNVSLFGTAGAGLGGDPVEWHLIKPLSLNRVSNSVPDDDARQSNTIFVRNCSTKIELFPSKRYVQPFQMRICYGYFKGDAGAGTQSLTAASMKSVYDSINDRLWDRENAGKQDFKWNYSKVYTFNPRQIYDEDPEEGDHVGADRVMVANWQPRKFGVNMKFNRRFSFANADADSLDGWQPIICIQCKPIPGGNQFTRPTVSTGADTGAYPSPRLHINSTTYFSDVR